MKRRSFAGTSLFFLQRMEETGALLNHKRLANAHLLLGSLAARPGAQATAGSQIRHRAGAVQEAVIRVLAASERPLRARAIHSAPDCALALTMPKRKGWVIKCMLLLLLSFV